MPFIRLYSLCSYDGKVSLFLLSEVPGASQTCFLEGDVIGYAVRFGDDANAWMTMWNTRDGRLLAQTHSSVHSRMIVPDERDEGPVDRMQKVSTNALAWLD